MKTSRFISDTPAWLFIPVLLLSFFLLSYCTGKQTRNTDRSVEEFKGYVDEQVNKLDSTVEENWEEVEKTYNEKKSRAGEKMDKMEASVKESYNKAVADWEGYKQNVEERRRVKQAEKDAALLKASLVPADIRSDLSNVNSSNIAAVYKHFIEQVETNKETYSKEQWVHVNNYWQSLNDVHEKLNKTRSVSSADNKTISGIKTKYAATKVLNKPFAESENKNKQ